MHTTRASRTRRGAGLAVLAAATTLSSLALPGSPAGATVNPKALTGLASVATTGIAGNSSSLGGRPSTGGRFIAFTSSASNLVPGDTNGKMDVFVRDTLAATTVRVSVTTGGGQGNGDSDQPAISAGGRYVVYRSAASNLVSGDSNGALDIFWRDLQTGTTKRVSLADASINQALGGDSAAPSVSDDGADVFFHSNATNLVAGDSNGQPDVFVRNIGGAFTERISVTSGEAQLSAGSVNPAASGAGRYVVFESSTNQVGTDTNVAQDIFLRDRVLGTTERVSVANDESQANGYSQFPVVSDDGRYVAFQSIATGLTTEADVAGLDVFRRDRTNGVTTLVTRTNGGQPANQGGAGASISADGTKVSFSSTSTNLVSGDTNGTNDVFVRNLNDSTTVRSSVKTLGGQLPEQSYGGTLSPDGATVAFTTTSDDGYGVDTNETFDIYWRGTYQLGPFSDPTGLIQRNSKDFTGAELPLGTLLKLSDKVLNGTASPASIIDDMAHGPFATHRAPVMRLYWSFFHRVPDQGGLDYWVGRKAGGTPLRTIAANFASSPEFKNTYGSLNDTGFVTLVYQNVLGRAPDQAGLDHWVGTLQDGDTRGDVMTAFSEASEGKRLMRAEVDTLLLWIGMRGRLPSLSEHTTGSNLLELNAGTTPTEVLVLDILTSSGYANHLSA